MGHEAIPAKLQPKPTALDAYLETPRETAILDYATQLLAASCMRERGFEIHVPQFQHLVEWHEQQSARDESRWFGLTDRAEASTYGYGDPPLPPKPGPELSTTGARVAYRGSGLADPNDSACRPRAEVLLYDVTQVNYDASTLPEKLKIQASARATARADYGQVYSDLGRCLNQAGYDVPDPEKPFASPSMQKIMGGGMDREAGQAAPQEEVQVALSDIDCKVKVNLVRRLEAVVNEEETEMIEANALTLTEYQAAFQKSLRRATRVMNGEGVS